MGKKVVYRHIRLDNNTVFYVGIGNKLRPYKKWNRNKHWHNIVNKHGYKVDVICENLTSDDAKELEMFLISEYGIENLVNYTIGGDGINGYKHTKETKRKLSELQKGKKLGMDNPFYGKTHTKETIDFISKKQSKKVVDLVTGKHYKSAKEAAKILGYAQSTLTKYLNGTIKNNKTNLRYE